MWTGYEKGSSGVNVRLCARERMVLGVCEDFASCSVIREGGDG